MKFFFIVNLKKKRAKECAQKAISVLERAGGACVLEDTNRSAFGDSYRFGSLQELFLYDIVIAVGGDGTIMSAAKYAAVAGKPLLGLNAGRLGFLSGAEVDEMEKLKRLLTGEYKKCKRMLLQAQLGDQCFVAVNDCLICKPALGSIIDVSVYEGKHSVMDYRADSVLFSTPIGSTAYALSNGGPVADPDLKFISMSPICAHSLVSRTYLFREQAVLTAQLGSGSKAYLLADGNEVAALDSKSMIQIQRSSHELCLLYLEDLPFFEIVQRKFL